MNFETQADRSKSVDPKLPRAYPPLMITGRQIRAARGLLGWSVTGLAERAGVTYSTIYRIERTDDVPAVRISSLLAIERALEAAGVIFLSAGQYAVGGEGVRLRD